MIAKRISILGSTGSVGTQSLEVIRNLGNNKCRIIALAANSNIDVLESQIKKFRPEIVCVYDHERADMLREKVDIPVLDGMHGLRKLSRLDDCNCVLNSVVGSIGMIPTYDALNAGKDVLLANKESLVAAGRIITRKAMQKKVNIIPIDSEHSAIFQCLNGEDKKEVRKIILTCSGGSFRDWSIEQLRKSTVKDALLHPTWNMGRKITIDSATLMNKGLEVIEARWLFDVNYDDIEVVIHPQSIVHSAVEFVDHSIIAQLGAADMKIPINYALSYPGRIKNSSLSGISLSEIGKLEFGKPDFERFPCLRLAYSAARKGGSATTVLNAANESAVAAFLEEKIGFYDIYKIAKYMLNKHRFIKSPSLNQIKELDLKTKNKTTELIKDKLGSKKKNRKKS